MASPSTRVDLDALVGMVKGIRIVTFHGIPEAAQELLKMELLGAIQQVAPEGRQIMILLGTQGGGLRVVEWWFEMIEGTNEGQYLVVRPCDSQKPIYLAAAREKLGELKVTGQLEALGVSMSDEVEGVPTLDPLKVPVA